MSRPKGSKGSSRHPRIGDLKWCFICQQYRDVSQFNYDRAHSDGLQNGCKMCSTAYRRDYQRQYYIQHRDVLLLRHRISAAKSHRKRLSKLGGKEGTE